MKTNGLLLFFIFFTLVGSSYGQSLLDLNEAEKKRQRYKNSLGPLSKVNEDKALPLVAFGTNIMSGTNAVGFRPMLTAGTSVTKDKFGMAASLKFTQVDDQKFDRNQTGQSLFIADISNFSANLGAVVGISSGTDAPPRVSFNAGLSLRGNSLFNLDSTTFKSEQNDIFTFNTHVGSECILFREHISVYVDFQYLSITNNRTTYHEYFASDALKDFWYFQPGFRFKALEGEDQFKSLVFDVSAIIVSNKMQTIAGKENTIIPVIRIGYTKTIDWKSRNINKVADYPNSTDGSQ